MANPKIEQNDDDVIYVNEKRVQRDSRGLWVAPYAELTPKETQAFKEYLEGN